MRYLVLRNPTVGGNGEGVTYVKKSRIELGNRGVMQARETEEENIRTD